MIRKLWQFQWGLVWGLLLLAAPTSAMADIAVTAGSGATIVDFDATHGGTSRCAVVGPPASHCPATVIIDTAGTAVTGPAGSPAVSAVTIQGIGSGTAVPISGSVSVTGTPTVTGSGSAGTAAAGVLTVQGIASMTPLLTTTTLSAETTKVIGTVNLGTLGGAGTATNQTTIHNDLVMLNATAGAPIPIPVASTINTIAASQTTQVLSSIQGGGTGAAGDYLSHCVIIPATTTPGVFTILNNATPIPSFPGGSGSVSNLTPITVVVGAVSTGGGWKITTTTNVSGYCVGKFT